MLPDIGASELLVIAIVALIVVGPKDLPMLLRKLGQFMARMRGMAAEFRASFDEMARQSELDDLRKEVEAMRAGQYADMASHSSDANAAFDEINQGLTDAGVQLHPPMSYQYETPAEPPPPEPTPKAPRKPRAKATVSDVPPAAAPRKAPAKAAPAKVAAAKSATPTVAAPAAKPKAKAAPRKATVERGS